MPRYANLSGHSGVVAYRTLAEAIVVEFHGGTKYEYTARSAGPAAVAEMKRLASAGRGLGTYISQVVHDRYERKFT